MKPLVSILIPAYNAEEWIAETIQSAIGQTWSRKEVIVVDDGSTDQTAEVARRFTSKEVVVVSKENQGAAAARNHALKLSQGDFIQWLDADDLLAPDKIEHQLMALKETDSRRVLLSSAWAYFNYRTDRASFMPTSLWQDLSPLEWMLKRMEQDLYMQTATWLTSRHLADAAGPWNTHLLSDDDVEYFCRVLLASDGTRFVPNAKVFYRNTSYLKRLSYVGSSNAKKDAILLSMKLQIQYMRSVEESDRVRRACLTYMRSRYENFYPERPDLMAKVQAIAGELGGRLVEPQLRWKYAWMKPIFGFNLAKRAQISLPQMKAILLRKWDKAMYELEAPNAGALSGVDHKSSSSNN